MRAVVFAIFGLGLPVAALAECEPDADRMIEIVPILGPGSGIYTGEQLLAAEDALPRLFEIYFIAEQNLNGRPSDAWWGEVIMLSDSVLTQCLDFAGAVASGDEAATTFDDQYPEAVRAEIMARAVAAVEAAQ